MTKAGVGTNRYAYSGNDPVNARDPGGNASCGTGLNARDCERIKNLYGQLRDRAIQSRDTIVRWMRQLDEGNYQLRVSSEEDRLLIERISDYYGGGVLTREALDQARDNLEVMADRIGEPGEGIVVKFVNENRLDVSGTPFTAQAHPQRNTVTLLPPFRDRALDPETLTSQQEEYALRLLGHEVVHPALTIGREGDHYGRHQSLAIAESWRLGTGEMAPWRNVDNTSCLITVCP